MDRKMSSSRNMSYMRNHLSQEIIKTHLERTRKFLPESLIFISASSAQSPSAGNLTIVHQLSDDENTPLVATNLTFPNHADSNWTRIHGSCDGLVLVEDLQRKIFILNPVTREIRQVPRSPFAFHPSKSEDLYGFGYDSVNRDYKVVMLSVETDMEAAFFDAFVSVYSLKTGVWKNSGEALMWEIYYHFTPGVYVEGRIHWKAADGYDFKYGVMGFDLAEDKLYKVPAPAGDLGSLSGQLCTVRKGGVCVMNEYGVQHSWTKFSIDDEPEEANSWPLCKLGRDRLVLLQRTDNKLVAYNLNDKSRKEIVIHGISGYVFDHTCFDESLLSCHGYNYAAAARE